jgi:hypothetical protein
MAETKFKIDAAEVRARELIADIVPMLGKLPDDAVKDVFAHLDAALAVAKDSLKKETEKRIKPENS